MLRKAPDAKEPLMLQCDASELRLGSTMLEWEQPVAFARRVLSITEKEHVQIEKELLAILFSGMEKIH